MHQDRSGLSNCLKVKKSPFVHMECLKGDMAHLIPSAPNIHVMRSVTCKRDSHSILMESMSTLKTGHTLLSLFAIQG